MIHKRMKEARIDAALDAYLHGARAGDIHDARHLHETMDLMLSQHEGAEGQWWLTPHARMVLAEMHRSLAHCDGSGEALKDEVLDAVQFAPHTGKWDDTCSYLHDLRIAISVANELCEQRKAGLKPDLPQAVKIVASHGEFDLDPPAIRRVYEEIASTVGGFREISHC
jgi:hypothetical protein